MVWLSRVHPLGLSSLSLTVIRTGGPRLIPLSLSSAAYTSSRIWNFTTTKRFPSLLAVADQGFIPSQSVTLVGPPEGFPVTGSAIIAQKFALSASFNV